MKAMLALLLVVILVGGAVGLSADHASADQPPDLSSVTCGPAALQQAQAAGIKLPSDAGADAMVCWYPARSR